MLIHKTVRKNALWHMDSQWVLVLWYFLQSFMICGTNWWFAVLLKAWGVVCGHPFWCTFAMVCSDLRNVVFRLTAYFMTQMNIAVKMHDKRNAI